MFATGETVLSERFGTGKVLLDEGTNVVVRFDHGIESCEPTALSRQVGPRQALEAGQWHAPLEVVTRGLAEAIQSVNDAWGVFSRSRIDLLPHQLWVCRQVNRSWPTRWLIADDVGLGKTIEAGLILLPLLSRGDVKRLLILCPASLVEQWHHRMRTMFEIRLAIYAAASDTAKADFWNTHSQVVASMQTLRLDRRDRHQRLLDADPWDFIVVDEAHHLNADEQDGPTLGYKLVEKLTADQKVRSMVFFTGTPHRGKNYGFLALLRLLRPDRFDPRRPVEEALPHLREVMIRNNKYEVTDLHGKRLFQPPRVEARTFAYTPAEAAFYRMLTDFIVTGKTHAQSVGAAEGRTIMLVLITMQKLASSSVAAIQRALRNRLGNMVHGKRQLADLHQKLQEYQAVEELGDQDQLGRLEEQIAELSAALRLMEDEEPRLRELLGAAEDIPSETKIQEILDLVDGRFRGRSVLFFTEYKATQSLLMSSLIARYGRDRVTFINGDERADDIRDAAGKRVSLQERRDRAMEKFNRGEAQFLVSTEAAGEGVDLQENCHTIIHVDLPWNPMRLHQRVGRLNRYGQLRRVDVISVRNPDTVESRIWLKLETKIEQIMRALGPVTEHPEDLMELVLGMTSPASFRELFTEAADVATDSLSAWFDRRTARFGGEDALNTVRALVGHCAQFNFQQAAPQIPRLDLPDLKPFFTSMLELNRRRVQDEPDGLAFLTPATWTSFPGARGSYQGIRFDRSAKDTMKILGVGHPLLHQALGQARTSPSSVAVVSQRLLPRPFFLLRITDRVTSVGGNVRALVVGVEVDGSAAALVRDWEIIARLNGWLSSRSFRRLKSLHPATAPEQTAALLAQAVQAVEREMPTLDLAFRVPQIDLLAAFWPGVETPHDALDGDDPA